MRHESNMAVETASSWKKPYSFNILNHEFLNGAKTESDVVLLEMDYLFQEMWIVCFVAVLLCSNV